MKRCYVIFTNPKNEGLELDEGETSCHHITIIEESENEMLKEDVKDTLQTLEDSCQSTMDGLKEVNLGTMEKLHPTFTSAFFI